MRGARRALGLFFVANVLFGAGLFFHAFLYNFYLEALGLGEATMGGAAAALTAGGLVALLPAGFVVDRIGARTAYAGAVAVAAAGLTAGALLERPLLVYLAAAVAGAGTATWRVAMGPIVMRLADAGFRSRAFSWNVGLLVGSGAVWMAVAGAAPGWLEGSLGLDRLAALRIALLLGALTTALSVVAFAPVLPGGRLAPRLETPPATGVLAPRIPPPLLILVVLVAAWMIAPALVTPFFNLYFAREHGLEIGRIGVIFAATHAVTAVVVFASGELASRAGPQRVLGMWMLLLAPALWLLMGAGGVTLAVVLYLVQGFVSPATNPLIDQILLERAPTNRYGVVSSWRNAATEVGGVIGAGAGGVLLQAGSFALLLGTAGAWGLAAAAALILALRRTAAPATVAVPADPPAPAMPDPETRGTGV